MNNILSIIIPAYNAEKYIVNCIESILSQNLSKYEIIIIDDHSTDLTMDVIKKRIELLNEETIKIFKNVEKGANSARKMGYKKSSGKYIMFSDADDLWGKNSISKMIEVAIEEDVDVVVGNLRRVIYDNESYKTISEKIVSYKNTFRKIIINEEKNILTTISPNIVAKLIKRECIDKSFFNDVLIAQDWNITYKALANAKSIYIYDQPVYNYIIRPNSITNYGNMKEKVEKLNNMFLTFDSINSYYEYSRKMYIYKKEINYIGLQLLMNIFFNCLRLKPHEVSVFRKKIKTYVQHHQISFIDNQYVKINIKNICFYIMVYNELICQLLRKPIAIILSK